MCIKNENICATDYKEVSLDKQPLIFSLKKSSASGIYPTKKKKKKKHNPDLKLYIIYIICYIYFIIIVYILYIPSPKYTYTEVRTVLSLTFSLPLCPVRSFWHLEHMEELTESCLFLLNS